MSRPIDLDALAGEEWEAHAGVDYVVVMRRGETTDNASFRLYGPDAARMAALIAIVPAMVQTVIATSDLHRVGLQSLLEQ